MKDSRYGTPHCWGKMTWILEYKEGEEQHVCSCEYGSKQCLALTRARAKEKKTEIDALRNDKGELAVHGKELNKLFYESWKES